MTGWIASLSSHMHTHAHTQRERERERESAIKKIVIYCYTVIYKIGFKHFMVEQFSIDLCFEVLLFNGDSCI